MPLDQCLHAKWSIDGEQNHILDYTILYCTIL